MQVLQQSGFATRILANTFKKGRLAENSIFYRPRVFEFTRSPLGVSEAPSTFQRIMENVLNGLDMSIAIIYIDDVVVPG